MRSLITKNGCYGPITTVQDREWTTVSTRLPFGSRWNVQPRAEPGDAGLAAEADQVQAGDARQRARVLGELAGELEAFGLGVGGGLAARDRLLGHLHARPVRLDEAQRLPGT